jgi:deoxycytidine triphosphate deaminase
MILGASEILERFKKDGMVGGFEDYDFKIEGATVDLRLDNVYRVDTKSEIELYEDARKTAKCTKLDPGVIDGREDVFVLQPYGLYFVDTIEQVNIPKDVYVDIKPRTTMFRSGLLLMVAGVNPGYYGKLTFGLKNFMYGPVKIQRGFRICQLVFGEIKGDCELYDGNWQGGRLTSNGEFDPAR